MRWCLEVILIQNFDEFSKLLLTTEDKTIVEFSESDNNVNYLRNHPS
ncbi:hypothetical protein [Flavobacterium sp. HSC-61S13]|nr:hypothetical protein [Flavobacterium sp. HSC-61S13]MCP1994624.1 hypothetical protein [Flavobacterium sp. HSC-61S13]